jgi:large subunit ribosomal protein L6
METRSIEIPKEVTVTLQEKTVDVSGEKGHVTKNFSLVPVDIQMKGSEIMVSALRPRRRESALVGTVLSHVQNMIKGVTNGFTYKLKIVYSHFPISVKVEGKKIIIGNFIGERNPRTARVMGDVKVNVKGDDVIVQGVNIEDVSQTAANIEQATRVKKKDPRKFLDGIYIYEKLDGMTS